MSTEVSYHADGYSAARPAINVKVYGYGRGWDSELLNGLDVDQADSYLDAAREDVYSDFWQQAEDRSIALGLGPIIIEGRSGGWLALTDGRDPADMNCANHSSYRPSDTCVACVAIRTAWLRRYQKLRDWCESEVREAPRRVVTLAEEYAKGLSNA